MLRDLTEGAKGTCNYPCSQRKERLLREDQLRKGIELGEKLHEKKGEGVKPRTVVGGGIFRLSFYNEGRK